MRTETVVIPEHTVTTTYYEFSELSEKAKERVREWYLEGQDGQMFISEAKDWIRWDISRNSDLSVAYQLCYRQGDHFAIYGKLYLTDVFEHIKEKFTEKEQKFMKWVFREFQDEYEIVYNEYKPDYERLGYLDDATWYLEGDYRAVRWDTIEKFERETGKYLDERCRKYMEYGYEFFYEVSDDDLEEYCDVNRIEFYEDGEIA